MGPSYFQIAADAYTNSNSDSGERDPSSTSMPSMCITSPDHPPFYSYNHTKSSPHFSASQSLYHSCPYYQDEEKSIGFSPCRFTSPNRLTITLPEETTHLYLTTSSHPYPSLFQTLSLIHISAALLTGIEALNLLYLHHVEGCHVLEGDILGRPLMLFWGLVLYFGTGVGLCFW